MAKANGPEVPSTSGERSDDQRGRAFGKGIARGRRDQRSKRRAEPQHDRRPRAFAKRRDFRRDSDLIWFFQQVGKGGQRKLGAAHDLRRWSSIDQAVSGLWRLCVYFTNPRGFSRPLVAPLVEDDGRHGAEPLYGRPADEKAELLHAQERELDARKLYAVKVKRDPDYFELAGLRILEKEYAEYARRRATRDRRAPEAIVSPDVLRRLVRTQFEYRRPGEYPTVDTTANVIGECQRFGDITWSTWRDYAVNPHAARTILHKRPVAGVLGMSDQKAIAALKEIVAEETSRLEEERTAEAAATAAKAERARRPRGKLTVSDGLSSVAPGHSVAEIAEVARLSQRRVRELLMAQGCYGVTIAAGEPPERWLDSEAGRAFKKELAAAIEERRQTEAPSRRA